MEIVTNYMVVSDIVCMIATLVLNWSAELVLRMETEGFQNVSPKQYLWSINSNLSG